MNSKYSYAIPNIHFNIDVMELKVIWMSFVILDNLPSGTLGYCGLSKRYNTILSKSILSDQNTLTCHIMTIYHLSLGQTINDNRNKDNGREMIDELCVTASLKHCQKDMSDSSYMIIHINKDYLSQTCFVMLDSWIKSSITTLHISYIEIFKLCPN